MKCRANTRFRLEITNKNAGPGRIRERRAAQGNRTRPGVTRTIVRPTLAGRHPFFGEFHPDTARAKSSPNKELPPW